MLKSTGRERVTYTTSKWYSYEANRIIQNINKIENIFSNRTYISAEDIVEHIAYCKYGCYLLLDELRELKKKLKSIEDKVRSGAWVNQDTASISKLTSGNIDVFINNITNISKLTELTNIIHEDLYISYFYVSFPSIYLPEPKSPQLPALPRESLNIKDKKRIEDMIKETIPYLNTLEQYHMSVYKLISNTNQGLDRILSK